MAASSTTSTVRSSSSATHAEVEQEPVDRAGVGEAFVGQADGGDPGRGSAEDLVAVQLERLPGQPQRPGLADPACPPRRPRRRRLWVRSRTMAAWSSPAEWWRSRTWRTAGPDHGAALVRPLGGAVDQLPLQGQQLRRREPVHAQPAVRPTRTARSEEPVGRRLTWVSASCAVGATGRRLARASTTSVRVKVDTCPVSPSGPASASNAASSSVRLAGRPRPPEQTSASWRSPTPCSASSPPPLVDAVRTPRSPWAPGSPPPRRWTP